MLKRNTLNVCLLIPAIVFGLSLNGFSENPCTGPDCPSNLSTIQDNVRYSEDWILAWDWEKSAKTITRDASVNVYVLGGFGPFTWSVSGIDFSLEQTETQGRSNRLNAGTSSCGSAFIMVTDARGYVTEGSLRNTSSGRWVLDSYTCGTQAIANWQVYEPYCIYASVTTGGGRQKQAQPFTTVTRYFNTESQCEDARTNLDCPTFNSPCIPFPNQIELRSYPRDGIYGLCGAGGRKYITECVYRGIRRNDWVFKILTLQPTDPDVLPCGSNIWNGLEFWQWECY